jgi:hypothetical protein
MDDFFKGSFAGQVLDEIATIDETPDRTVHLADVGAGNNDATKPGVLNIHTTVHNLLLLTTAGPFLRLAVGQTLLKMLQLAL